MRMIPAALTFALLTLPQATSGATSPTASTPPSADLILRGGVIYPVQPPGRIEGSLVIQGGRILFVGPDAQANRFRGAETRIVELQGRTVIPGLIDAHSHLENLGTALEQVDLTGAASYNEVIARLRAAAESLPVGSWVRGRGWDQNRWLEKDFPHHRSLSEALPEHPVWATRVDGHAALLNQAALVALGLPTGDSAEVLKDPSGGRFLRDDDGALTGVLIDNAMDVVGARVPAPSLEDRTRRLTLAAQTCLRLGLTTVTDMGVGGATLEAYHTLRQADELPLRAALFLTDDAELLDTWFQRGPMLDPQARLQVRGIKLYGDGALGSRGAALVEPYSDDAGNLGLLTTRGDHVLDVARKALDRGFQVGIHAIGDRGNLMVLDALEAAFDGRPRPEVRFRIEHVQIARTSDLARLARLGIIASMQPTHATSDMPWAGDRVGHRRLEGAYAWRKVLDAGGRLALGSDFPVEYPDPRLGLYAAVTRQDTNGAPEGGWLPDERLSREEALRGFTLDAAYSLFLDGEVGSLAPGKRADIVVFERDIMTVDAREIPSVQVDLTLVDGEIVFQRDVETPSP